MYGIIGAISTTYDGVIANRKTFLWGFESINSRQKWIWRQTWEICGRVETGEDYKKTMDEDKDVIFKGNSIVSVTYYEQDAK